MIDFKNKDELPTTVVMLASVVVMAAAVGFMQFVPKPTVPSQAQNRAQERKIDNATKGMEAAIDTAKQNLQAVYTWPGTPESVGPVALKQVNGLLQNRHLKLVGFHSQKSIEQPNITLIPFVVSVEGGFTSVMAFTKDLEKSGTKLVVNLLQVANADQTTDKVTASIGITAYQLPQPATTDSSTTGNKPQGAKKNA